MPHDSTDTRSGAGREFGRDLDRLAGVPEEVFGRVFHVLYGFTPDKGSISRQESDELGRASGVPGSVIRAAIRLAAHLSIAYYKRGYSKERTVKAALRDVGEADAPPEVQRKIIERLAELAEELDRKFNVIEEIEGTMPSLCCINVALDLRAIGDEHIQFTPVAIVRLHLDEEPETVVFQCLPGALDEMAATLRAAADNLRRMETIARRLTESGQT